MITREQWRNYVSCISKALVAGAHVIINGETVSAAYVTWWNGEKIYMAPKGDDEHKPTRTVYSHPDSLNRPGLKLIELYKMTTFSFRADTYLKLKVKNVRFSKEHFKPSK